MPNNLHRQKGPAFPQKWKAKLTVGERHHYLAPFLHEAIVVVKSQNFDRLLDALTIHVAQSFSRPHEAARKIKHKPAELNQKRVYHLLAIRFV
ncbi:MAG: hypothetical protein L0Z50_12350 [Verrucomicrobiales bacterium]|nr:hypothetical protein [Verrucomicrobiales bacterium]